MTDLSDHQSHRRWVLDIARDCTEGRKEGNYGRRTYGRGCRGEARSTHRKNYVQASAQSLATRHATYSVDMGT